MHYEIPFWQFTTSPFFDDSPTSRRGVHTTDQKGNGLLHSAAIWANGNCKIGALAGFSDGIRYEYKVSGMDFQGMTKIFDNKPFAIDLPYLGNSKVTVSRNPHPSGAVFPPAAQ